MPVVKLCASSIDLPLFESSSSIGVFSGVISRNVRRTSTVSVRSFITGAMWTMSQRGVPKNNVVLRGYKIHWWPWSWGYMAVYPISKYLASNQSKVLPLSAFERVSCSLIIVHVYGDRPKKSLKFTKGFFLYVGRSCQMVHRANKRPSRARFPPWCALLITLPLHHSLWAY